MTKSKVQYQKVEESKVNIMMDESSEMTSKFSIDKRRKPNELNSIKQSVIRLDVSESDSHSKSRQNNSDRSSIPKKTPNEEYSPTFKFTPEPQKTELDLKLRKVTEQESDLVTSSNINKQQSKDKIGNHAKRRSGNIEIDEMVLDENNIKQSQAGSFGKVRMSTLSPQLKDHQNAEKKITDPDEDDDEDFLGINLLAVSKISK